MKIPLVAVIAKSASNDGANVPFNYIEFRYVFSKMSGEKDQPYPLEKK